MLGSPVDAEDAAHDALLRAWRGLDRFDGRSSLDTWLHRIATNVCLDVLSARRLRDARAGAGSEDGVREPDDHPPTLGPSIAAAPSEAVARGDPALAAELRQGVRHALAAALSRLPARQRAALLLAEVLGWPAAEIAAALGSTVPAVNSALQRARAALAHVSPDAGVRELEPANQALLARYVDALERDEVGALAALLCEDGARAARRAAARGPGVREERTRGGGGRRAA